MLHLHLYFLIEFGWNLIVLPPQIKCITLFLCRLPAEKNKTKNIGQSGGASRWRVCYQRGLPRLVWGGNTIKCQPNLIRKQSCKCNTYPGNENIAHFYVHLIQLLVHFTLMKRPVKKKHCIILMVKHSTYFLVVAVKLGRVGWGSTKTLYLRK